MNITVDYFAALREQAGISSEVVSIDNSNALELYASLRARHGFTLGERDLKLAVNDQFVAWSHPLSDGDRVVFIPPVSGG